MRLPLTMSLLRERFEEGENIMQLLREAQSTSVISAEAVLAAYDLQAGSYVQAMQDPKHRETIQRYASAIARILDPLGGQSLLEAGAGEATTLAHVVSALTHIPELCAGFDISWSRIAHGMAYAQKYNKALQLFVGDMFAIPLLDSAVDIVYTSHSIEPNSGREQKALLELHRVARRFVILLEPASSLGNEATKERIVKHRYCTNLERHARDLGLRVVEHKLFDVHSRPDNQTELIVIEKLTAERAVGIQENWLACPVCRSALLRHKGQFYCQVCSLVFPVIGGIPCLVESAGILASQFLEF